jgi:SpoVK/Ycf46/Vps4 family AAA+-type ATPase
MLVKAVAHHTTASFIRVVGSEFVQKYLGEGPRMVRDVFRLARENAPAIIFIDEIDAIATKRFDAQTGADREVQRILLELLNQMDGFDQGSNVKVCQIALPNFKNSDLASRSSWPQTDRTHLTLPFSVLAVLTERLNSHFHHVEKSVLFSKQSRAR